MLEHDEMKQLAGQEIHECKRKVMKLQEDIKDAIIPKDEADEHAAIVEIRAGKSPMIIYTHVMESSK